MCPALGVSRQREYFSKKVDVPILALLALFEVSEMTMLGGESIFSSEHVLCEKATFGARVPRWRNTILRFLAIDQGQTQ